MRRTALAARLTIRHRAQRVETHRGVGLGVKLLSSTGYLERQGQLESQAGRVELERHLGPALLPNRPMSGFRVAAPNS